MPESEAETLPDDLIARTRPCPSCEQAMNFPPPDHRSVDTDRTLSPQAPE